MVWWIVARKLAPFAVGPLGALLKLGIVLGVVVMAGYAVGLDPIGIVLNMGASLVDSALDVLVDAIVDRISI